MDKIFLKDFCKLHSISYMNMWRYMIKLRQSNQPSPDGVEFIGRYVLVDTDIKTTAAMKAIANKFQVYKKKNRELSH